MFKKKLRKDFHISTAYFYVVSDKNQEVSNSEHRLPASVTRPCYRVAGHLVAL